MWMVPSYRTRSWAYVELPKVGDRVRYMNDGFDVTVTHIRRTYVLMSDGTVFRKRVDWRRIWTWITDHMPETSATETTYVRVNTGKQQSYVKPSRKLKPAMHYVATVNLHG